MSVSTNKKVCTGLGVPFTYVAGVRRNPLLHIDVLVNIVFMLLLKFLKHSVIQSEERERERGLGGGGEGERERERERERKR